MASVVLAPSPAPTHGIERRHLRPRFGPGIGTPLHQVAIGVPDPRALLVQFGRLVGRVAVSVERRADAPFGAGGLAGTGIVRLARLAGADLGVELVDQRRRLAGRAVAGDHRAHVAGEVRRGAEVHEVQAPVEQRGRVCRRNREVPREINPALSDASAADQTQDRAAGGFLIAGQGAGRAGGSEQERAGQCKDQGSVLLHR
jgi:hypothetical protein